MTLKRLGSLILALIVLVGAASVGAPSAFAHGKPTNTKWSTTAGVRPLTVTCSGNGCDNQDPDLTGCDQDAFLQEQDNYAWGNIQNWWSASCNANWTLAVANSGYWVYSAAIMLCGNGAYPTCYADPETYQYYTITDAYNYNCNPIAQYCGSIPYNTHPRWYTNMWYSPSGSCTVSYAQFATYNTTNVVSGTNPVSTGCH